MTINGRPGVAAFAIDQPESVITIDLVGKKIAKVYLVRNPDKLRAVASQIARN